VSDWWGLDPTQVFPAAYPRLAILRA